jgi:ornithine cyclodeaminase/alanine dehydrogenase-like protein (mu-crystallin family)
MLILSEPEIRELAHAANSREIVRASFRALHRGEATLPGVISVPFATPPAVAHVKAGHLHDDPVWTVKVSVDIQPGPTEPTRHGGMMLVISSLDGSLAGVLLDNGYLTDLRTGAAGAIAADLLSRQDAATVAIVGAGNQARFQLDALRRVRNIQRVQVASRSAERAKTFVDEVERCWRLPATLFDSVEEAVRDAEIVVTTTPAEVAILRAEWLAPGAHVTAVGSDEPTKQELDVDVLFRAAVVAVDDESQAARLGELHHAIEAGFAGDGKVVTLGQLLEGEVSGRTNAEDITVADLTGVGTQDAAIAAFVFRQALRSADAPVGSPSD